jgi:hypothetical protein
MQQGKTKSLELQEKTKSLELQVQLAKLLRTPKKSSSLELSAFCKFMLHCVLCCRQCIDCMFLFVCWLRFAHVHRLQCDT